MTFIPNFLPEAAASKALRGPRALTQVSFVTPASLRDLAIDWAVVDGQNGRAVVAVCEGAICWVGPTDLGEARAVKIFKQFFASASLREKKLPLMTQALKKNPEVLPLLLVGTEFQHSVWRLLLRIPRGNLVRYADLAKALGKPRAARAVGNAVGANPVAWLVPCHRVGHSDGGISGFASGEACKRRWLELEAA
jgi:AraC family transcriptional regulator, regulatory protein of adaptative response / methylated-DNA-[protein]-cysteine methyltransferase